MLTAIMGHHKLLHLLLIACYSVLKTRAQEDYCYNLDDDPYPYLGYVTGYFENENPVADPITVEGCTANSFWFFTRHGARNPAEDYFFEATTRGLQLQDQILQNHDEGRGFLCEEDLSALAAWTFDLILDDALQLNDGGVQELEGLANKFSSRFPDIFTQPYDESKVRVRHTDYDRTQSSAEVFVATAYPGEDVFIPDALEEETLLRYYDFCTKWQEEVVGNGAAFAEQQDFLASQEVSDAVARVTERLGFQQGQVSMSDADLMWDLCRFEKSRLPSERSPWCAVFTEEDLRVWEYADDLASFGECGYSFDINEEIACPPIQDMVNTFNADASQRFVSTLYFAHDTPVKQMLTLMGVYNDPVAPTADNYNPEEVDDRKYRVSQIGGFSANLAFIYYECDDDANKVMIMHNEKVITPEGCDDAPCDWDQFQSAYADAIACPFDDICENN